MSQRGFGILQVQAGHSQRVMRYGGDAVLFPDLGFQQSAVADLLGFARDRIGITRMQNADGQIIHGHPGLFDGRQDLLVDGRGEA